MIRSLMQTARAAAEAAGRAAQAHHRTEVRVETKADRTPVTVADREAEAAARAVIAAAYPDHRVLGEESGDVGDGPLRWIIDPIDGTRGFIRGGTFWGPVIGVEDGGQVVAGALALPALGETYYAGKDLGCFRDDGVPCRVSKVSALEDATLSLGELPLLVDRVPNLCELWRSFASVRCYGDLAAPIEVLRGRADLWLEAGVQHWDIAPMGLMIREAGGTCTTFDGRTEPFDGTAIGGVSALWARLQPQLRAAADR
jgi:histidinol-phosphatase